MVFLLRLDQTVVRLLLDSAQTLLDPMPNITLIKYIGQSAMPMLAVLSVAKF